MQLFAEGCTGVAHNHDLEVAVRSLTSSSTNADIRRDTGHYNGFYTPIT